jgi:hypothetical protein
LLCASDDTLTTVIANTPASIARVITPSGQPVSRFVEASF